MNSGCAWRDPITSRTRLTTINELKYLMRRHRPSDRVALVDASDSIYWSAIRLASDGSTSGGGSTGMAPVLLDANPDAVDGVVFVNVHFSGLIFDFDTNLRATDTPTVKVAFGKAACGKSLRI